MTVGSRGPLILRNADWRAALALWALLLQILFAAEHLGAQGARALSGVEAAGFLHLCVSEPESRGGPERPARGAVDACALCASAACNVAGVSAPPGANVEIIRTPARAVWFVREPSTVHSFAYAGSARGPPVSFAI